MYFRNVTERVVESASIIVLRHDNAFKSIWVLTVVIHLVAVNWQVFRALR